MTPDQAFVLGFMLGWNRGAEVGVLCGSSIEKLNTIARIKELMQPQKED